VGAVKRAPQRQPRNFNNDKDLAWQHSG
jgi:hypothetical protein